MKAVVAAATLVAEADTIAVMVAVAAAAPLCPVCVMDGQKVALQSAAILKMDLYGSRSFLQLKLLVQLVQFV